MTDNVIDITSKFQTREEGPIEDEIFQCSCGSIVWYLCRDKTMECPDCGAFMDIQHFLNHTDKTKH